MESRFPIWQGDCATSATLLEQLRLYGSDTDWCQFYERYARLIYLYVVKRSNNETLAVEVVQETMVNMLKTINDFHYNPDNGQFRSFLFRIVHARIHDAYSRLRRDAKLKKNAALNYHMLVELIHAEEPPNPQDSRHWDSAWEENQLCLALERVRSRVQQRTWRSFEMSMIEGQPPHDVVNALAVTPNLIYQHRSRVMTLLKEELVKLQKEMGE